MTLADALFQSNKFYANVIVGALIHKITLEQAQTAAGLIQQHAAFLEPHIPLKLDREAFFASVMRQESGADARAMNFNLPLGPNPDLAGRALEWLISRLPGYPVERRIEFYLQTRPLENADMGIAMRKVRLARTSFPGLTDRQIVEEHLFRADYGVPWMAKEYAALLLHATKTYPDEDPKWAATGCYQSGKTGFKWAHAEKTGTADVLLQRELTAAKTDEARELIQKHYDKRQTTLETVTTHITRVQGHFEWFRQNLSAEV